MTQSVKSALLTAALLFGAAIHLAAQPWFEEGSVETIGVDELLPGMQGVVWTVFRGTEIESFAVEVVGVLHQALGPTKDMIICRLIDPRVQDSGAVAGMSGSPLYIEGRLAGALSYQVQQFETVRHAGFTPIADILEVSRFSHEDAPGQGFEFDPLAGDEEKDAASAGEWIRPSPGKGLLTPLQPVFSISGVHPATADLFREPFEKLGMDVVAAGGGSNAGSFAAQRGGFKPGDAVSVALVTGDITLAGTGTVSYVDGDQVYAFGHPMFGFGAVDFPMAHAEIVTILASQLRSFKISNTSEVVGTIRQDRLSSIYGQMGGDPRTVPVRVTLLDRHTGEYDLAFEVVQHPQLTPLLSAVGLSQAILGRNEAGHEEGFRIRSRVDFPDGQKLVRDTLHSGPGSFFEGLTRLVADMNFWLINPFDRVYPANIEFEVESLGGNPLASLEQVRLPRNDLIRPGEDLPVSVSWREYQREAHNEVVRIPVDRDWAGKDLEVVVATGRDLDLLSGDSPLVSIASAQNGHRSQPAAGGNRSGRPPRIESFDELVRVLERSRREDGIYLAVVEKSSTFWEGIDSVADLPPSVRRITAAANPDRNQERDVARVLWETHLLPDRLVQGTARQDFRIPR